MAVSTITPRSSTVALIAVEGYMVFQLHTHQVKCFYIFHCDLSHYHNNYIMFEKGIVCSEDDFSNPTPQPPL